MALLQTKPGIVKPAKIVDLGELMVDHGEKIAAKLARNTGPKGITWSTPWLTDEYFPDEQTRKIVYAASAWYFGVQIPRTLLKALVEAEGKIRGTSKPLIDSAIHNPRPKLDDVMPLVAAGQVSVVHGYVNRRAMYLNRHGEGRCLNDLLVGAPERFDDPCLFFLVLERVRDPGP